MTETSIQYWLTHLARTNQEVELLPPATEDVVADAERAVGALPAPLRELLKISNGLVVRGFRIFSAFDPSVPKKTWESLQRANDVASDAITSDEAKKRLIVFADINGGYGYIDRTDGTIWYRSFAEDRELGKVQIHRTTLSFRKFIEKTIENGL